MSKYGMLAGVVMMLAACGGGGGSTGTGGSSAGGGAACGGGGGPPGAGGSSAGGGAGGGSQPQLPDAASAPALKTVFASNYLVGAAIPPEFTSGPDSTLLIKHMSSVTAENAMKPDTIQPSLAGFPNQPAAQNFAPADTIVGFAVANHIQVRGHTLLWYVTAPDWFFAGCSNDPAGCLPNVRLRLHDYIWSVMRHFGGQIYAWDVVNEVVNPDPNSSTPYRTNGIWYQTYANAKAAGANVEPWDYIEDAFRDADE